MPSPDSTTLIMSAVSAWLSDKLGQGDDALRDMALRRPIWSGCQGGCQPGRGQEELACAAVLL